MIKKLKEIYKVWSNEDGKPKMVAEYATVHGALRYAQLLQRRGCAVGIQLPDGNWFQDFKDRRNIIPLAHKVVK